jgi:seryl-tRNA synthetase
MLDIQFIRDNAKLVQEKSKQKNVVIDIDHLIDLDNQRRQLQSKADDLREQRNKLTANITSKPSPEDIERGSKLKIELSELEGQFSGIENEYKAILKKVPNMPADDVPIGSTEDDNKVIKHWGEKSEYDFEPKTHWDIGAEKDLIDRERAAKVSGSRFAYLKGGLVQLQFALMQFTINQLMDVNLIEKLIKDNSLNLVAKPFVPILPPMMMRTDVYEATGRLKAEEITYKVTEDDLWLTASAEHSLCSMYMNEILAEAELPIRYIGYNTAFRREAGTYGKDMNGITRMHHFDKLEMEVFSTSETSSDEHLLLIAIQEHMTQQLEIPYRVILKCTADIGSPNARGVDIDMWFPGMVRYMESHTADYMTDYQTRDLKTRVRRQDGTIELVHTNDATAFALARTLAAIIENYQTHDGNIIVPERLRPYMGGKDEI